MLIDEDKEWNCIGDKCVAIKNGNSIFYTSIKNDTEKKKVDIRVFKYNFEDKQETEIK